MRDIQDFDSLKIKLASSDTIRAWSYGEVKKPETINYRTLRPEKDGLFCERIFGTTKEWECYCGKFKSIRYKGIICDRCGVEVAHFKVRRERMGHIELAAPVAHIWYYRAVPSRIGMLLNLQVGSLRSVLYYEKYIVIDAGDTDLKKLALLSEEEYLEAHERYGGSFTAGMGAEAIKTLLENIDLDALATELREEMIKKGPKSDKRLLKRIQIVEDFRRTDAQKNPVNKPEWMILDVIPVIPPELRPMVQLDGGRFATSDLNDLYRRVINRNNRLKRLNQLSAPDIIIRNEKRMLQEAVDALFDNSKRKRVVKGASNRPLKSISDMLKGKQGRFRQNLLGKRVDYSGRSVIVVGPELKMWQCGLPTKMAMELFKPFIMKKLMDKGVVFNIKKAKVMVEQEAPEVFAILDEVVREHPVMLNRAPTLHRLGIQSFEPVLVEGKAIKLHPLVCHAFNADFDGDQMAVHVPLTQAAQMECWTLMLSARNLLDPANGKTIVYPSQDMVLGIYYLTSVKPDAKGTGKTFSSETELLLAAETCAVEWLAEVSVPVEKAPYLGKIVKTTAGRLKFNQEMPDTVEYENKRFGDKELKSLIEKVHKEQGPWLTVQMLDSIKAVGYRYATFFGATISVDDIIVPPQKPQMIEKANKEVEAIQKQYHDGIITGEERYNRVCDIWSKTNEDLTNIMMDNLKEDRDGFNTIYMMATSGARGSRNQIRQLAGMRGLMAKPSGDIIELPIRSNFKEGLSVIEFFISTNGARKGLSDTALKTADAGYLTRRLVDIAQDVVINEEDCGTINGIDYTAVKDGDDIVEPLRDRIAGRFCLEQVVHPITGILIAAANTYIDDEKAAAIEEAGVEKVRMRTVLTCESKHGVCCKCYGRNLAHNKVVEIGEAVGIIAAQSIGQPGTQLTMRTFHVGGTASKVSEENRILLKYPVLINSIEGTHVVLGDGTWLFTRRGTMTVTRIAAEHDPGQNAPLVGDGDRVLKDTPVYRKGGKNVIADAAGTVLIREGKILVLGNEMPISIPNGSQVTVRSGTLQEAHATLAVFDPFSEPIISEVDGYIHFEDIIPGNTIIEELDEETGMTEKRVSDLYMDTKQPRVLVTDEAGNEQASYYLPAGAYLLAEDNTAVKAGDTLAKMLKEASKTSDITGGLPRVSELFEARKPRSPTVLAQITGTVSFKGISKGKRTVVVTDDHETKFEHLVPVTKRLLVRNGDRVAAGESLCDGAPSPHDILSILGENALQNYLMDEIQQVYRMQGVAINDKHIGIIVRQMLRKVEIVAVGDTRFIFGQQVDKAAFQDENDRVLEAGGQCAIARPMFQAITKAALNINSFISAASFQETTRVLTNAAIAGSTDELRGLKENVIIGHLIPAGTGIRNYKNIKLYDANAVDLDEQMNEIIERRRLEKEAEELAQQQALQDIAYDMDED